ncbi:hypothetical protein G9A89_003246 [Geosiphon pyriformis]|nr:hypothetical protein G9A89_003246 [Geosiphon pyriformis]
MKHILFDLTYGRTATLPINFTVETYPVQPINEENFQETLQKRVYTLLSTLEGKRRIAATYIEHSQAQQKKRHDNKLPPITSEFKQALEENLLIAPIDISPNATMQQKLLSLLNEQNNKHILIYKYFHIGKTLYKRKLELEATNLTPEAIQKQIHNEFKTAAGPTNTHYKLRAAFRLYDLFNTCENVLQNLILQPMKVQYIGKLTELKFQQFSDQITSIILDHYLNITDSAWTSIELSLEEEIMLPVEF